MRTLFSCVDRWTDGFRYLTVFKKCFERLYRAERYRQLLNRFPITQLLLIGCVCSDLFLDILFVQPTVIARKICCEDLDTERLDANRKK